MSKLLDKLERISEGTGQPLGFGPAAARQRIASMLVVASAPAGDARLAAAAAEAGVDAVVVTIERGGKRKDALAQLREAKTEMPWGVSADSVTREEVAEFIDAGCDFLVFAPAHTPAAVLEEERIGKVLRIDAAFDDRLARAIDRLSVDAVLLSPAGADKSPLTVQQLMVYERLAAGAGKHLLAAMPPGMSTDDLETLWGLGVRGVVVDVNVAKPEQRLSEVQEAIRKLPTSKKRRGGRISATLPLSRDLSESLPPDEEDEEDI